MTAHMTGGIVLVLWITGAASAAAPLPPALAQEAAPSEAAPVANPTPSPTPVSRVTRQLQNRQLQLPSYARYGVDAFADAPDIPAFSEEVEVFGRAMDKEALTAKMRWWMNDFEPMNGRSGGSRFQAPTLADMRDHRPSPPQALNFQPLLGWLLGKIKNLKDDDDKR